MFPVAPRPAAPAHRLLDPRVAASVPSPPPSSQPPSSQPPHEVYVKHVFFSGRGNNVIVPIDGTYVVAVELVRAWIPRGEYVIHDWNCWLDLEVAGEHHSVAMAVGDSWDANTLLAELQCLVRRTVASLPQFNASIDRHTGIVRLAAEAPFTARFYSGPHATRSLASVLGFASTSDTPSHEDLAADPHVRHQLHGQWRTDLSGARFIDVRTKELTLEHTDGVLAQVAVDPTQPVVHFDPPGGVTVRRFAHPLPSLRKLTLAFETFDAKAASIVAETRRRRNINDAAVVNDLNGITGDRRPYTFNGLMYNVTIAVHMLRWKTPDANIRDMMTTSVAT